MEALYSPLLHLNDLMTGLQGRSSTWRVKGIRWRKLLPPYDSCVPRNTARVEMLFYGGRKTGEPGEKPSESGRDRKLNSRYTPGIEPAPEVRGMQGKLTLCQLRHPGLPLGFLRRNLRLKSPGLKAMAYTTLVRPHLQYGTPTQRPAQTRSRWCSGERPGLC